MSLTKNVSHKKSFGGLESARSKPGIILSRLCVCIKCKTLKKKDGED